MHRMFHHKIKVFGSWTWIFAGFMLLGVKPGSAVEEASSQKTKNQEVSAVEMPLETRTLSGEIKTQEPGGKSEGHGDLNNYMKDCDPIPKTVAEHPFNFALVATYLKNPEIRSKVREQYATDERVAQAVSGYRPNIVATGTAGEAHAESVSSGTPNGVKRRTRPVTAEVSVTQSLYEGGKTMHGVSKAKKEVFAARESFADTENTVLFNAAQAYFDLWLAQATLELNKKNVEAKKKRMTESKARYEVGELTLTDVAQAESELSEAIARKISAQAEYRNGRATYIRIVCEEPSQELAPPEPIEEILDLPETKEEIVELALREKPVLKRSNFLKDAAKHNIHVAEGELLPKLSAEGNFERSFEGNGPNSRSQTYRGLVRLTVPLYRTGSEWSAVRQANESFSQARMEVIRVRRETIENAELAWENLYAAKERVAQFKLQIKAAKLSLEGTYQENLVGERTLLDVFDAENKLLEIETNFLRTRRDYLLGGYRLLTAIGRMSVKGLSLPVQAYDLEGHYKDVRYKFIGVGDSATR